jgi:hypothetical protein
MVSISSTLEAPDSHRADQADRLSEWWRAQIFLWEVRRRDLFLHFPQQVNSHV